ncbi:MAG: hypothetical protein NT154_05235 [Verrucomicrobia bacterium]|nr:hypothetical protein [Verrucomicrobiota bacterium]
MDILGIKREITGFWAGVAEGAAPAVQKILDWLRKIDLTSIGQQIGATMGAIMEALKSGEITILITDSFDAAFEQIGNNAARLFNGIFAMLLTRLTQLALEIPDQFNVIAPAITGLLISTGPSKIFIPTAALWSVAEANDPAFIPPPPSPAKASRRPSQ